MEKLTLEQASSFLPYEVKFTSWMDDPTSEALKPIIHTCNGINFLFGDWCLNSKETNDAYPVQNCKLLLYPSSQLTKPMEDGSVPIVELAKIAFPDNDWRLDKENTCAIYEDYRFYFSIDSFFCESEEGLLGVASQVPLFRKLAEMKVNFMNLPEHLWIDVTTLPENPYLTK